MVQLVKIRFGDMVISRLTVRPYITSLLTLLCCLAETIVYMMVIMHLQTDEFDLLTLLTEKTWIAVLLSIIEGLKVIFLSTFFIQRVHDDTILLFFIVFQHRLKL